MLETLTSREREIFNLLLEGVSPKEIAHKLNISLHTVAFHRTKLYNKLGVQSIQELFAKYSTNDKAPPPEALESEATVLVSPPEKKKRLKVLLSVGIALVAFSMLLLWILPLARKSSGHRKAVIIPAENLGFYSETDVDIGGNSTSEVYVSLEEIDGVSVDVLNIKTNLVRRESKGWVYAKGQTYRQDLIQQMRQANGIRFKALGDGKSWSVQFHTIETTAETDYPSYRCIIGTVRDQVIVVDIPYSSLILLEDWKQYWFDFNKETIKLLAFEANPVIQGYGSSFLQIFDFEIY